MRSLKDRLFRKVSIGIDCWLWTGYIDKGGYGRIIVNGKSSLAHRVSWFIHHGFMPDDCVCHACDVRNCVNPDHLWLGTYSDNRIDMVIKGRGPVTIGRMNGRSVLIEDEVLSILKDNRMQLTIASDYGVSKSTISAIKTGKLWPRVYSEWISLDATRRAEMKL